MISYKNTGVNIQAGYSAVELIKDSVEKTYRPEVSAKFGGLSGLFEPNLKNIESPVFVSATDGVGTKLKIAFMMNEHTTVGIDCVAKCVNDIICCGAEPLFFMDYISMGKNIPEKVAKIVQGISDGCIQARCSLTGGETAEMPGFYESGEYDIAGFVVGIVDKKNIIDGKKVIEGDKIIGIKSSGLHSNGYSLVKRLLNLNKDDSKLNHKIERLGKTLGEELITPSEIYANKMRGLIDLFNIKAIANITGGGFVENIPRMLPEGLRAKVNTGSWETLPIFDLLRDIGDLSIPCMYSTFNMGIGMAFVVSSDQVEDVLSHLNSKINQGYLIGEVKQGENGVDIV